MPPANASLKLLVVDDHEAVLGGTVMALEKVYPAAKLRTAGTAQAALEELSYGLPSLLMMDLSIPEAAGESSKIDAGIELLRLLLADYPELNIVVQSAHVRSLALLKPAIDPPGRFHHC